MSHCATPTAPESRQLKGRGEATKLKGRGGGDDPDTVVLERSETYGLFCPNALRISEEEGDCAIANLVHPRTGETAPKIAAPLA